MVTLYALLSKCCVQENYLENNKRTKLSQVIILEKCILKIRRCLDKTVV